MLGAGGEAPGLCPAWKPGPWLSSAGQPVRQPVPAPWRGAGAGSLWARQGQGRLRAHREPERVRSPSPLTTDLPTHSLFGKVGQALACTPGAEGRLGGGHATPILTLVPRPTAAASFASAHCTSPRQPGGQAQHLPQLHRHPSSPPGAQALCLSPPHPGRLGSCSSEVPLGQICFLLPTWCEMPAGQRQSRGSGCPS